MAYASNHIKLTFGGTLADSQEIWSCGLSLMNVSGDPSDASWFALAADRIEDVRAEITTFVGDTRTQVPSGVKLEWVKMALIGTDGKYVTEPVEVEATGAGAFSRSYIPQAALVNTLVSTVWKDPGRYNRFYLPIAIDGTTGRYQLDGTEQTNYLAALKDFINAVDTVGGGTSSPGDFAVAVVSNAGAGHENACYAVRLGRVIDTQRRRRNQLSESYLMDTLV